MGLLENGSHRDDLYALTREGCSVNRGPLPPIGTIDRQHIFIDGTGEIIPATLLRNSRRFAAKSGKTFKQGPVHSHDQEHLDHYLETVNLPDDLLRKYRKAAKKLREERKKRHIY